MADNKIEKNTIAVRLVINGDTSIHDRLKKEVKNNPEASNSSVVRSALRQYFNKLDKLDK